MENFSSKKDAMMEELAGHVKRSLDLLDEDVGRDYHEAVQFAPALVEKESPIIDFLRTEDFHSLRTVNRIALYWKTRRELFGEDRWLRPMNQTGAGALTPDQVEILRTGFVVLTDSPQPVCISNRSRLPKGLNVISPQTFFYFHSVLRSNKIQEEGLTMLHVINSDHRVVNDPAAAEIVKKIRACLPSRTKKIIVSSSFEPGREHLLEYMAFQQHRLSQTIFGSSEFVVGNSVRDTINALEESGLDRACIPASFGGDYFYHTNFDNWIRSRLSIEDAMVAAPPVQNTAIANATASRGINDLVTRAAVTVALGSRQIEEEDGSLNGSAAVQRMPGESESDFEKRRKYIYGKRSYARKRQKLGCLQEHCDFLRAAKTAMQTENYRLQSLLDQAHAAVANILNKADASSSHALPLLKTAGN